MRQLSRDSWERVEAVLDIASGALVLPIRVCVLGGTERREFYPRAKRKTSGHRPSRTAECRDVARARAPRCGTYPLITRLQRLKSCTQWIC